MVFRYVYYKTFSFLNNLFRFSEYRFCFYLATTRRRMLPKPYEFCDSYVERNPPKISDLDLNIHYFT